MLERLGTPTVAVDAATEPFDAKVRLILASRCANAVVNAEKSEAGDEIQKQLDFPGGVAPSTETLRAFIERHALKDEKVKTTLRALEQFERTGRVPDDYED